ncbi:MAG: DUF4386 domain-containing protein [Acidobacteriota bacterium]|nr:DUF4386 domain-containing protein [Acidobacteriota bacterium]
MAVRSVESSPQLYARGGGALYLALILSGVAGMAIRSSLIVSGDAAATAARLMSKEPLWRLAIGFEFAAIVCATALAMVYFVLLGPVSRELNLLATFLRLVAISVQAVAALDFVAALLPLRNPDSARAFTPDQLYALMTLAIRSHAYGVGLALFFFGCCFLFHGRLIFRSGFLPPVLGILIQVAGVCYLTLGLAQFVAPDFARRVSPFILLPPFVGEASLCLWLLLKGVDVQKWQERASAARVSAAPG